MLQLYGILLVGLAVSGGWAQQMQRMCTCDEARPCKESIFQTIQPCADKCERFAAEAGANYQMLRDCVLEYRPRIVETVRCSVDQLRDTCSAVPTDFQVPKRYPIGIELAFVEEIGSMLTTAGVSDQLTQFVALGRRFAHCMQECVERQTNKCAFDNVCALNLPPDNQLVAIVKNCAIQNQLLTTPVIQSLCECAVRSGVSALAELCPRLIIQ
ncbi:unnamed protein product [Anisakis simplex]|uniref:Uncharacterized protein n=1 Tax=Anisakis simplex TaxID=6269 RepID=A0A0M3K208_ANISI|nr:unnamed protein product [Anisakis simplex]